MPARARARALLEAGLCLFAASLPVSVAGANIGWVVAAIGLAGYAYAGAAVDWKAWRGGLAAPLALLLAAAAVSTAAAPAPLDALRHLLKDAHKLGLYALLATAFTVCPPRRPLQAFAAGSALAALYGGAQWLSALGDPSAVPRAHGWLHAVTYGEQMAVAFCGAACLLTEFPAAGAAAWAAAALSGTALFMSNTRGAVLGASAGLLALGAALPRLRRGTLIAAAAALAAGVGSDLLIPERSLIGAAFGWGPEAQPATRGQLARMTLWSSAVKMGLDHPLIGVGIGGFRERLPSYVPPGTAFDGNEHSVGTAHNLYLHHFAERGLFGLAALGWFVWAYFSLALRRALRRPDPLRLFGLTSAAAFLVMNLTEVALHVELVWMLALFAWTAAGAEDPVR